MIDLQYFGHSFFKIGFSRRNILVDPFFGSSGDRPGFERMVECSASPKDVKDIALILISHEHFDHFDKPAIESIVARDNCCVVAHAHLLQELNIPERFKFPITMNQEITLRNLQIKALPAHHPNSFYPLGFLISYKGQSVYHAGDTALINSISEITADVALLPIGGTYTMDCVDAIRAVKTMKPKYAVPMHFDTFKMIQQDPKEFKQKIEKSVFKTKPVILKPGQKVRIKP